MKWRIKETILNDEKVFEYSSIRLIVISTVELSKESLNKIYDIIKEENSKFECLPKITSELKVDGALLLNNYGILKRNYVEINTKRVYHMDMRV